MDAISTAGFAKTSVHGIVDITKGIYQSCDVFFYTLAEKLGIDRIAKYATALGLGQKTGIDLPRKLVGSCLRKNGRFATSSRNGLPEKPFRWVSDRGRWRRRPYSDARHRGDLDGRPDGGPPCGQSDRPSCGICRSQSHERSEKSRVDADGLNLITDEMSRVLLPEARHPPRMFPASTLPAKLDRPRSFRWRSSQA